MKLSNYPEVAKLNGYMEAMSCCLQGCNYVVWFSARGIGLNEGDLESKVLDQLQIQADLQEKTPPQELQKLMLLAYPQSQPHLSTMVEYNHHMLTIRINTFIAHLNTSDHLRNISSTKKGNLITGFWRNVEAFIDYRQAKVLQYKPAFDVNDELWDFIIWGFTFVIINQAQKRCLLIHGGASD